MLAHSVWRDDLFIQDRITLRVINAQECFSHADRHSK